jgi:hypothetical protein
MNKVVSTTLILVGTAFLFACAGEAQISTPPPVAPVPPAVLSAKRIFVANAGADSGLFPHPFSGNPDRAYNQFYAAFKADGRWQLVSSPREADLVLELRLTAPYGPSNADKQKGASDPLPMFRLAIYDAGNHFLLWALTETIESANLQKTHDRNFENAVEAILADFETLSGKPPTAAH